MGFMAEWIRRAQHLIHRGRYERELQEEMEAHREMMGEPVKFGNTLRLREESGDVWCFPLLASPQGGEPRVPTLMRQVH
jgi:hypothetical protein